MAHETESKPAQRFVVIGTSSGGLAALRILLASLPATLPAAVLVTMHVGKQQSVLPSLLARSTTLHVGFARNQDVALEGHVYIAPPDQHLLLERGKLRLIRGAKENHTRPAIDPLFRSAAISHRSNVIGIVLTGDLDDGTVGLQAIKACGGIALVQDPAEADAPSMPSSALRYVEVDHCLALEDIGKRLIEILDAAAPPVVEVTADRAEPFVTENEICAQGGVANIETLDRLGEVSRLTCPDCGGSLWEMSAAPLRFRCHTGHSYTNESMRYEQDNAIEEALWAAVRLLHEKRLLLQRLMLNARQSDRDSSAAEYEMAHKQLDEHIATLTHLITAPSSMDEV